MCAVTDLDWGKFCSLPGAPATNFESLWRVLIRRHYGRFGHFRALAHQPGVEFHLELHSPCDLGEVGRWYGWQCKWYELSPGRPLGSARRSHIKDALAQSAKHLPQLTDWVLCTRFALTSADQRWLDELPKSVHLHLWTAAELNEHLAGPAELYRGTYFGDLILTPDVLRALHDSSTASVRSRWVPELHQVVDAERTIRRALVWPEAWPDISGLAGQMVSDLQSFRDASSEVPPSLRRTSDELAELVTARHRSLADVQDALLKGTYDECQIHSGPSLGADEGPCRLLRGLRSRRHPLALEATNLVADLQEFDDTLFDLREALATPVLAVVAAAGCGKTQLAAQLTAPCPERPAGVLLYGRDLQAGHRLDDLARRITIQGRPLPSFEALAAAVDGAGRRARRRLPIVIDGLNEAEDPRDWKAALAGVAVAIRQYPYVLLLCTLRGEFKEDAVPDDIETVEMAGFQRDMRDAVARYFRHYRIDGSDVALPRLVNHPLTLRIFCEVTNPTRSHVVGAEAMPTCLTALFDRYLDQVADRVAQLSSRTTRFHKTDVWQAIEKIGCALWEAAARQVELSELRVLLRDDGRTWHASIVRALEQDGILFRGHDPRSTRGGSAVAYDPLAGHIIADWLYKNCRGDFESWVAGSETQEKLFGRARGKHPLADDIFRALVGLSPRRRHAQHLWPLLNGASRARAVYEAARLEGEYLDAETVGEIGELICQGHPLAGRLFPELRSTRATAEHPLNAAFLHGVLRDMSNADRDLCWTEWVRTLKDDMERDLERLEERWGSASPEETPSDAEILRARWVMWTLTTTVRPLRDRATRALWRFGSVYPKALFDLTVEALTISDPYVPERMLAASYGVAMTLWADPVREDARSALLIFGAAVRDRLLSVGGADQTAHALIRDYAGGVVELAGRVSGGRDAESGLGTSSEVGTLAAVPDPFHDASAIVDEDLAPAHGAIRMDFGNYTIGGLIRDRGNYDFENETYQRVHRQIERRLIELGYSKTRFEQIDNQIMEDTWRRRRRDASRTDRYGKKYAWIAYFEMYGLRREQGLLAEWKEDRPPDADIDPSFPGPAVEWAAELSDVFSQAPSDPCLWMQSEAAPEYDHLLCRGEVDGREGPWALLEGYVEQTSPGDDRRVFTFLRGVFVRNHQIDSAIAAFNSLQYPGNWEIPEPADDHYVYAGEIPWSVRFGSGFRRRNGTARPDRRSGLGGRHGRRRNKVLMEVPVCRFSWESYHSELNRVSGVVVPAPRICEVLGLSSRRGEWDLRDRDDNVGTLYRVHHQDRQEQRASFAYIRTDLLAEYLGRTGQRLVWFVWGERTLRYGALDGSFRGLFFGTHRF